MAIFVDLFDINTKLLISGCHYLLVLIILQAPIISSSEIKFLSLLVVQAAVNFVVFFFFLFQRSVIDLA